MPLAQPGQRAVWAPSIRQAQAAWFASLAARLPATATAPPAGAPGSPAAKAERVPALRLAEAVASGRSAAASSTPPTDGARRGLPHGGGCRGRISTGLARDGALGELGAQVQVIKTAITNQSTWVLSQGQLEQQGWSFRYSSGKE